MQAGTGASAITGTGAALADHPRFHGGHRHHTRVFIGSGFAFGYPYPFGYPGYYYPPAMPASPPQYVEQADDAALQNYWYRCDLPEGYYPYIQACPGGWLQVPALPPAD